MSVRPTRSPRLGHTLKMKFVDPVRGLSGNIEVVVSSKLIDARKQGGLASFLTDGATITSPYVQRDDDVEVFPLVDPPIQHQGAA